VAPSPWAPRLAASVRDRIPCSVCIVRPLAWMWFSLSDLAEMLLWLDGRYYANLEHDGDFTYQWISHVELWWTYIGSLDLGSVFVQRLLGILLLFGGWVRALRSIFWACSVDLWIFTLRSFLGRVVLAYSMVFSSLPLKVNFIRLCYFFS
jgi:hypothetical protein